MIHYYFIHSTFYIWFEKGQDYGRGSGSVQLAQCFPFTFEEGPSKPQSPSSSSSPPAALALLHAASHLCTSSANSRAISSSSVDGSPFNASSNSLINALHTAFSRQIESILVSYASKHQWRVSMLQQMPPHVLNCVPVLIALWICLTNLQWPGSLTTIIKRK